MSMLNPGCTSCGRATEMIFTMPPRYKCEDCGFVFPEERESRVQHNWEGEPPDTVDHPPHYTSGGIETIDAIEAWGLNFHLGNAVKYISRAGKKDTTKLVEDLQKARWYLDREITRRTKGQT